jgi:hypothetical protein
VPSARVLGLGLLTWETVYCDPLIYAGIFSTSFYELIYSFFVYFSLSLLFLSLFILSLPLFFRGMGSVVD